MLLLCCGLTLNSPAGTWVVYDLIDEDGHAVQDWMRERILEINNVKDSVPIYFRITHLGQKLLSPHHHDYKVIGAQLLAVRGSEYLYGMQVPASGAKIVIREQLKRVWNKGDKLPKRRLRKIGEKKNGKPKYEWANVGTKEARSGHNAWPLISVGAPELLCINLAGKVVPPAEKETVGALINANDDDDDQNGKPDKDDDRLARKDDDILAIRVMHPKAFPIDLEWDDNVIHVYKTSNKQFRGGYSSRLGANSGHQHYQGYDNEMIYAEGINPGSTLLTMTGPAGLQDRLRITVLNVCKVNIAMDGNRDDDITFDSADDDRYLFWVNDDIDVIKDGEEDDAATGTPNCNDNVITCKRDLEDFTRLHIQVDEITANQKGITYWLKFENVTVSSPAVNAFAAIDESLSYLRDNSAAGRQLQKQNLTPGSVGNAVVQLDNKYIKTGNAISPFILEGRHAGKGDLTFIVKKNGTEICRKGIRLDLRSITAFYQKYIATVSSEDNVNTTSAQVGNYTYSPPNNEYLLYVHGWNMAEWEKDRWTETVFKRLWWQKYKGHVGVFQWPTYTGKLTYNASELRAWRSGQALNHRIMALNSAYPGQIRVIAHSMGNVVMGEALRLSSSPVVHTYIAAQAAIPAHCYDNSIANYWNGFTTPNVYGHYFSGQASDAPYLAANSTRARTMAQYFNSEDYALRKWWEINNEIKPDTGNWYYYNEADGNIDTYNPQAEDKFYYAPLARPDRTMVFPADRFEIFARCAESRSRALGMEPSVAGFGVARNLQDWGYNGKRYAHSREFKSNIINEWPFWAAVIDDAELNR